MTTNSKLRNMINNRSVREQIRKYNKESFELMQGITCYDLYNNYIDQFPVEEANKNGFLNIIVKKMAAVLVLIKQFQIKYDISDQMLDVAMLNEIDSQIDEEK